MQIFHGLVCPAGTAKVACWFVRCPQKTRLETVWVVGRAHVKYTAWDSEIESLTSVDASLIEPDRRKTRRRHRVTAALAPSESCLLPCDGQPASEQCIAEAWFTIAFFFSNDPAF